MYQQHVIDWWRHRGYAVTVLSDRSLMCESQASRAQSDPDLVTDAIRRIHAARWAQC